MDFNIHNLVKVKTNIDIGIPQFLKAEKVISPDLTVTLSNFDVNVRSLYYQVLDLNEENLYYECRFLKFLEKKVLLRNLLGKTKIDFISSRYSLMHRIGEGEVGLLRDVLQIKLLQRGYTFVHSACVAKNGEGIILIAPPETGKTFTSISLVKNYGFKYLSDDLTIIGDKWCYCYPTPLTIHPCHIKTYGINMGLKKRFRMVVSHFMAPYASEFVLDVNEVLGSGVIEKECQNKVVFLLERGSEKVEEVDSETALMKTVAINRGTIPLFQSPYVPTYAYYFPHLDLDEFITEGRKICEELLENAKCFILRCKDSIRYDKLVLRALKR